MLAFRCLVLLLLASDSSLLVDWLVEHPLNKQLQWLLWGVVLELSHGPGSWADPLLPYWQGPVSLFSYGLQASLSSFSDYVKFIGTQPWSFIYISSTAGFVLWWQSWVFVTEDGQQNQSKEVVPLVQMKGFFKTCKSSLSPWLFHRYYVFHIDWLCCLSQETKSTRHSCSSALWGVSSCSTPVWILGMCPWPSWSKSSGPRWLKESLPERETGLGAPTQRPTPQLLSAAMPLSRDDVGVASLHLWVGLSHIVFCCHLGHPG